MSKWYGVLALPVALLVFAAGESRAVERKFINPANGYTQVVAVRNAGATTLYVSGQIGEGETLEAQMREVFKSLGEQLRAAGADFEHLVKINTYVVGYRAEDLETFRSVRNEFMAETNRPASTLVGVGRFFGEQIGAAVHVGVVVSLEVIHRIDHLVWLVRAGAGVQIDETSSPDLALQDREVGSEMRQIDHPVRTSDRKAS